MEMDKVNYKYLIGGISSEQACMAYAVRGIRTELDNRERKAVENGERAYDQNELVVYTKGKEGKKVAEVVDLPEIMADWQGKITQLTKAKLTAISNARAKGLLPNGIAQYGYEEAETTARQREFKRGRCTAFGYAMENVAKDLRGYDDGGIDICKL